MVNIHHRGPDHHPSNLFAATFPFSQRRRATIAVNRAVQPPPSPKPIPTKTHHHRSDPSSSLCLSLFSNRATTSALRRTSVNAGEDSVHSHNNDVLALQWLVFHSSCQPRRASRITVHPFFYLIADPQNYQRDSSSSFC
ncbi:hypothetical protein PIB30_046446 [Stylosanthes scabra]|uniref:Uncharacterized protein n=1 Tax=Stylosanthes scabra TaxID=79078 RepID=A0ABU6ZF81_9FABA|nr:hypothetical protein [Stylosanthes scabra]